MDNERKKRLGIARSEKVLQMERSMSLIVYWTALLALAISNLIGAVLIIPFLLMFRGTYMYAVVIGFGLLFGFLFNVLIRGIEHLKLHHHLTAWVFIPAMGILDVYIIVRVATTLSSVFNNIVFLNLSNIIILYIVGFIIPYLIDVIRGKHGIVSEKHAHD